MTIISIKEIQQKRLDTCLKCPDLGFMVFTKIMKCNACGCPIKSKIALNNSSCPKGKW